jgi:hypothetical protein
MDKRDRKGPWNMYAEKNGNIYKIVGRRNRNILNIVE